MEFTDPARAAARDAPGASEAGPDIRTPEPSVLLVDDRPENLLALEALLDSLPVRLVRATTAEEALRYVDEEEFAVILLDVQMPGTDGLEAARLIKARERGRVVPILFITALDRDRRRVTTGYQAGAVDYLFKPLDPDELRAKVGAFLDLHRTQAEDRERRRRYADRLVYSSEERYRQAAADAERARAALEVAERGKGEFLSRMSHELRTPLNAILGYVQILDLGIPGSVTPEQHNFLNRVRQSAVHLLSLVNQILDLVTVESMAGGFVHEVGHLGDACETALILVRMEAATRGLTVTGPPPGEPGAAYVGDPDRVRQALVHLLTNAIKFTAPGGRVTVACGTADGPSSDPDVPGPGRWAYVRVADTGIGIPAGQLASIFDAFTQVDGGRTRSYGGAGVGLAVSRRLARAMGGEVTARSAPGEGSAFTLWLPTPRAAPRSSAARPARAPRASVDGPAAADVATTTGGDAAAAPTYRQLAALGTALSAEHEAVTARHAARLRAERSLPNVDILPEALLRDHTGTLVSELAHVLTLIGQTEGRAPELLRDGTEILRLLSELHGAQRNRLGWSAAHLAREVELLHAEVEAALRRAAGAAGAGAGEALGEALGLVRRVLDQSRRTSVRAFRSARHAEHAWPAAPAS